MRETGRERERERERASRGEEKLQLQLELLVLIVREAIGAAGQLRGHRRRRVAEAANGRLRVIFRGILTLMVLLFRGIVLTCAANSRRACGSAAGFL